MQAEFLRQVSGLQSIYFPMQLNSSIALGKKRTANLKPAGGEQNLPVEQKCPWMGANVTFH